MISLPTVVSILIFGQALGAAIGACTAVWGERSYVKAMKNGRVDQAEHAHLLVIGQGLRYGMSLLLLASFGLVVVSYLEGTAPQLALSSSYWILMFLALTVITVSSALARRRLPFHLASATLFTAWWFLVYLSFGWLSLSFGAAVMSFVVASVIFYGVLYFARSLASR
jgi:hypothetical membrane protein